jgi:hypothetical protein
VFYVIKKGGPEKQCSRSCPEEYRKETKMITWLRPELVCVSREGGRMKTYRILFLGADYNLMEEHFKADNMVVESTDGLVRLVFTDDNRVNQLDHKGMIISANRFVSVETIE